MKGRGLLATVLTLPDNWKFSIAGLVSILKENKTAIKTALKELQDKGYLTITKIPPTKEMVENFYMNILFMKFQLLKTEKMPKIKIHIL